MTTNQGFGRVNFSRINAAALLHIESIVLRWLPDGRRAGIEWVAKNPLRNDRRLGSFKINMANGAWGDFSTGDYGGDLISLAAYLHTNGDQRRAALNVAEMIGVNPYE